ncbi:hypothetical protein KAFR_0B03830 [Kazachstania africana CBS 2517]|uniref:EamA domain-containing protein n=1 Tax=Kazachstania africana (strain ATCC 22294 / BCRC 22015 / CBS 2517 / CECT 1963 / NBRC 1671 / NRRL Y-8276) TaxID=1071382 RepID=H2AQM9_KAZAF|nr:hypothetical protein KAFR_0B03830 [Kazachstania africana CBS 2517]CCF56679.1 hypothetical protein KAFR_0B03830 [Kazachstania africana CBS 2517]
MFKLQESEGQQMKSNQDDIDDSLFKIEDEPTSEIFYGEEDRITILRDKINSKIKSNIGIVFLAIAQFFNSTMIVSTKVLETGESKIKPLQVLVVRMVITYLGCLIYMYLHRDTIKNIPFGDPPVRKWLLLRGMTGFFGVFGMYYSLQHLSISNAILITFLAPSLTIVLAAMFLHERINLWEIAGSLTSLFGVILIIRPPFLFGQTEGGANEKAESSNPEERLVGSMIGLLGTLGISCVYIIIRRIGKRAHAIMNVAYFSLVTAVISLFGIIFIPSMSFQIPQTLTEWLLFSNLGFCGFFYQLILTIGIQKERAGRGSLLTYTQLIYALFWDLVLYHFWPSIWSWSGMFLIIGSTLVVLKFKSSPDVEEDEDGTKKPTENVLLQDMTSEH